MGIIIYNLIKSSCHNFFLYHLMKTTLKDIAEDTGYSVSTVSRALRGDASIHPESESKIIDSARRLNYAHLPAKADTMPGDDIYFAVVTNFHDGEFYSSFFNGFTEASDSNDNGIHYGLHSFSSEQSIEKTLVGIQRLREFGYSGAVIFMPYLSRSDYQKLVNKIPLDFPLISTSLVNQPVMDTIAFDGYSGGFSVAQHFHRRGYKTGGILYGPQSKTEALIRGNGFSDYCKQHTDFTHIWSFNGNYTPGSGRAAFSAFDKLRDKPKAVFAANDEMAIGFMQSAISAGYDIPGDVAIAGYDDLRICRYIDPPLTSVTTDFNHLARHITSLLKDRLKKPVRHQGIQNLIPVQLTIRQSS